VRYPTGLVAATMLRRIARFTIEAAVKGKAVRAHVANSGRILELLAPGLPALLRPVAPSARSTSYDLVLVKTEGGWVSADARLPNLLIEEALAAGRLQRFKDCKLARREVPLGESRIDFLLACPTGPCLLEVKSVTLVQDGVALFPDCRTIRGARQLRLMAQAAAGGQQAAIAFVVQRGDVHALRPFDDADPDFGRALREAAAAGVLAVAYRCHVSPCAADIESEIPVLL
jgi:sugar fermentation stimulation protein A